MKQTTDRAALKVPWNCWAPARDPSCCRYSWITVMLPNDHTTNTIIIVMRWSSCNESRWRKSYNYDLNIANSRAFKQICKWAQFGEAVDLNKRYQVAGECSENWWRWRWWYWLMTRRMQGGWLWVWYEADPHEENVIEHKSRKLLDDLSNHANSCCSRDIL